MTFVEFLAAAMEIDAEATVEVRSVHFPSYGRREMRYALYSERRGWAIGGTPGAALDRFRNALTLPTPETVGEVVDLHAHRSKVQRGRSSS